MPQTQIVDSAAIALLLWSPLSLPAVADTLTGRVVKIADGNTLTVLGVGNNQYKVRLSGIDAPESGQPYETVSKDHWVERFVPNRSP